MSAFMKIYYVILAFMAIGSVFLSVRISSWSLQEKKNKIGIYDHKEKERTPNTPILLSEQKGEYKSPQKKQISDVEAALHYIDFQKDNWEDLYEIRRKVIIEEYEKDVPDPLPLDGDDPEHSSFLIHDTKQGYYILLMHNVCYDFNRGGINLYLKNKEDVDLSAVPRVFSNGKSIEVIEGTYPNPSTAINDPNSYMLVPHSARNIAHYMEVYTFIYHILHQPHKFPRVHKVFYPSMENSKIYLWIQHYKEILLSMLPPELTFENIFREQMAMMATNDLLCFRRIMMPSRMSYLFYGGIFISPTEVETIRAASYKYYHLNPIQREGKLPRVMLMTRANVAGNLQGRHIANRKELSLFLRRSKQWLFSENAMELLTPNEQAETMLKTDVLIGVLGSGFANMIYMLPGSVCVSFSPPFVGGFFFSTMAEYCEVRYIPVYNYSIVPPNECNGLLGKYGEMRGNSEYCLSTLYTSDIYFNIGTVSSIMRQALTHIRVHKYHTQ